VGQTGRCPSSRGTATSLATFRNYTLGGLNAFEKNLVKLERGAVDVIPEDPVVFYSQIRLLGREPSQFRAAGELPGELEVFVVFADNGGRGETLKKIWDKGMRALRKDGSLEKILARYGLSDWKRSCDFTANHEAPVQQAP
jgi:polar amino acid transport system substrate-binding protein